MPQGDGLEDSKPTTDTYGRSLLSACNARFDALIAEGEVCFDAGTTTVIPVGDSFKMSFRLCPTLLSKPVIISSPTTDPFSDPLAARPRNPFEDPDPRFIVECPVLARTFPKPTHQLLINKFPVYRPQLLVTTIAVKPQADDLEIEDLRAGMEVLTELQRLPHSKAVNGEATPTVDFMGIYNCGLHAGNSQPHKHLQIFPKPESSEIVLFPDQKQRKKEWRALRPIETSLSKDNMIYSDPDVPYVHFFAFLPEPDNVSMTGAAVLVYDTLLDLAKQAISLAGVGGRPSHNLIFTRHWMLIVPRKAAFGQGTGGFFQGPQVNAAGMVGLVWMSNDRELEEWKRRGVAKHLRDCGLGWDEVNGSELAV